MKVYEIPTPDVLERAAEVCKWASHRKTVLDYVARWYKSLNAGSPLPPVTLELGRQAQLFRNDEGKRLLATMYVIGARQFVQDEGLVEV